jgi:hypothetical protein
MMHNIGNRQKTKAHKRIFEIYKMVIKPTSGNTKGANS